MFTVPEPVCHICRILTHHGFKAFVVGGAIRDSLLGRPVKDWDVATDARPDSITAMFQHYVPTGLKYGTVTVYISDFAVEVTAFRRDGPYRDGRHPEFVQFVPDIGDDLARRDFTVNAMALDPISGHLIDPFGGRSDLNARVIRAVGDPRTRFGEDALRMMRGIRLSAVLGFSIDPESMAAFVPEWLDSVSPERIRDEFSAIILSPGVGPAVKTLRKVGLLGRFLPELADSDIPQNEYHTLTVFSHCVRAAEMVAPRLQLRLAALLHDIGKPAVRSVGADGRVHFYRHEQVGAEMAGHALNRLRYERRLVQGVQLLISQHMSVLSPDATDRTLRRVIHRIGREHVMDLAALKFADDHAGKTNVRISELSELTRRLDSIIERGDPTKLQDLAVNGQDVMEATGLPPGTRIGRILNALLDRVMGDPSLNHRDILMKIAAGLSGGEKKRI